MVSIIILNYNAFDLTVKCIQSVIEKTKKTNYEIILVDNNSTEKNPDIFLKIFPNITLIKNNENKGFARGCNDGISKAKGNIILLLNNDVILLNEAIDISYNFLLTHPEVGALTCKVLNEDYSPQSNCQPFPSILLIILQILRIHKLFPHKYRGKIWWQNYFDYKTIAYPDWIWGTFFMFPKKILDIFPENKLTETFWMYYEDMEWCWWLKKNGYKVAFLPEAKILHLLNKNKISSQVSMMRENNLKKFMEIYYGKTYKYIYFRLLDLAKILG